MMRLTEDGRRWLVEHPSELPLPQSIDRLYLDVETRSGDKKRGGLMPYNGDRVCGVAVTWDDHPRAYYAACRHADPRLNLPVEAVTRWCQYLLGRAGAWVNHNVKFDAHFLHVDGVDGSCELHDTRTLAKMIDSDRLDYGLKTLGREWLKLPMDEATRLDAWLRGAKTKDFADAPADLVGEYACQDVLTNRDLYLWLLERRHPDVARVWDTEIKLTAALFDVERDGMHCAREPLLVENVRSLRAMVLAADQLKELTGSEFVNSSDHMYALLITQMGLPVLALTDPTESKPGGAPSFEKETLQLYLGHPKVVADPRARKILELILQFRTESQFRSLYCESLLEHRDEHGLVHPSYNQIIRTGRMSCSNPNAQQMSKRAKALFQPRDPSMCFFSADASQIEFRIIVHYIRDPQAIEAYARDATTDFHQWVADLCGITRKPAKTINFAMAYGAGKRRITEALASNPEIMEDVLKEIEAGVAAGSIEEGRRAVEYAFACERRAEAIYHTYHERLPGLKPVADRAAKVCRARGFVHNAFGRRRHLPTRMAHKAFNSVVQGCAMDYIKDRMVALAPRYNPRMRDLGIRMIANVHDEILFEGPREVLEREEIRQEIITALEVQSVPFRVPFHWSSGTSSVNWKEATPP